MNRALLRKSELFAFPFGRKPFLLRGPVSGDTDTKRFGRFGALNCVRSALFSKSERPCSFAVVCTPRAGRLLRGWRGRCSACSRRWAAWPCPRGLTALLHAQRLPGFSGPVPGHTLMLGYSFVKRALVYNLVHLLLLSLSPLMQIKIL